MPITSIIFCLNDLEDPLCSDPATGTQKEGLSCIKLRTRRNVVRNTFRGAIASCTSNKHCWAVEKRGRRGYLCQDPKTKDWKTTLNGMVNLEPKKGSIVWLKGK